MMTQKQFETELTNFRKEISTWGKDAQDVHSFIEHLKVYMHDLGDRVWLNGFVINTILDAFDEMMKAKEFEPHFARAKKASGYLFIQMPTADSEERPDLIHAIRGDNIKWLHLSNGKRIPQISSD